MAEILWCFGYRVKPDGRVLVSEPFNAPSLAKYECDNLRAQDMAVTSRFTARTHEEAFN